MKQAIVDKVHPVSSAALVSSLVGCCFLNNGCLLSYVAVMRCQERTP